MSRRPRPWRGLVPVTALLAGLLFASSAATADGTDLRSGRRDRLADLIRAEEQRGKALEAQARRLRGEVRAAASAQARGDDAASAAAAETGPLALAAGLLPVAGPGVTVTLDDAPRPRAGSDPPAGATPDDLVVHQQDLQAVLNGLRAGGAEAIAVMGERLTATSAVRCVGNTLLLHGRVHSPPFVLTAIGDPTRLLESVVAQPGVELYLQAVEAYGLGFDVREHRELRLAGHEGPLDAGPVRAARPADTRTPGAPPGRSS